MPTFAELRERAVKAADSGRAKFNDAVDRRSSVPLKKTNWDPHTKKAPPPPPPSRSAALTSTHASTSNSSTGLGPPPINSSNRPGQVSVNSDNTSEIDWANLSPEDKEAFFSWLDEYFTRLLSSGIKPQNSSSQSKPVSKLPDSRSPAPPPVRTSPIKPPNIPSWSRPKAASSELDLSSNFALSHPPSTVHGSSALDLAYFFHPSASWSSAWYDSDNLLPPPLHGSSDHLLSGSWQSRNNDKQVYVGLLFSDLSLCWGVVEYSTSVNADPNDTFLVRRSSQYLPRPKPLGREPLVQAHETYGETIAAYAESYVGSGQYCARGECWDLANEALKYFDQYDYVLKPVPSIGRTHGHLIFEGKANGRGNTVGRWRGGDDRVRRGDIVEWRKVKIALLGGPPGSWAILGEPDHTAIIVRESTITGGRQVVDGDSVRPEELGSLVVVEQSVGSPPDRKEYDLHAFEEGEMWIYRPVGMQTYLGCELSATPPVGLQTMTI